MLVMAAGVKSDQERRLRMSNQKCEFWDLAVSLMRWMRDGVGLGEVRYSRTVEVVSSAGGVGAVSTSTERRDGTAGGLAVRRLVGYDWI